jgi:hypothetical protein
MSLCLRLILAIPGAGDKLTDPVLGRVVIPLHAVVLGAGRLRRKGHKLAANVKVGLPSVFHCQARPLSLSFRYMLGSWGPPNCAERGTKNLQIF